jgi:hypothetical protein
LGRLRCPGPSPEGSSQKKAIKKLLACEQVSELNELAELTTLHKTLNAITKLTYHSETARFLIATIGGVEAVVKVMQTFPKCQTLQEYSSVTLLNLSCCSIGEAKAIELGEIEVLLAAVNNHLDSAIVCEKACGALVQHCAVQQGKQRLTD